MPEVPPQSFRAVYRDEVTGAITLLSLTEKIKPHSTKSGEYIILWSDIKTAFKNPSHVRHNGVIVPFIKDKDFNQLEPLRIPRHPGVTLDVVIENPGTEASTEIKMQYTNYGVSGNGRILSDDYNQGLEYYEGKGNSQDYVQALFFLQKAANKGHPRAIFRLQMMTESKKGIEGDYTRIIGEYVRDAGNGVADAQCSLGYMYYHGYEVSKDYHKAVEWYQKAVNQGHARSQNNLGDMHYDGYGVTRDYSKAVELYKDSADQGFAAAQNKLGYMYLNGHGVPGDDSEALKWFQDSANQEYPSAQCNMGIMYKNGYGVDKSLEKAEEWWNKAASEGHVGAKNELDALNSKSHDDVLSYKCCCSIS
ncbi:hypothetical protein BGZ49_005406 [Haplosporangium sp. Z 27]|nr:hypothetical protein BGZ49_005406 [Haplosporangium sp. Z 27]